MHNRYDAIVVGAGPAGSSTALFLGKAGLKTLLIEKEKYPRDKICGDAHSGKTISVYRELGLINEFDALNKAPVRGLTMVAPNNRSVTVPYPNAKGLDCAGYIVRRIDADNLVFQAAKRNENVTALENTVCTNLIFENNKVIGVKVLDKEKKEVVEFYSRVVVGADGFTSVVARELKLPQPSKEHTAVAVRGYWKNVEGLSDNIELFFTEDVLPGYLWIFPLENKNANIGLGMLTSDAQKRKINPIHLLEKIIKTNPMIVERMKNAELIGKIGAWNIPNGSFRRQVYGNGWVLVGDAAHLVDPFSGEGIANAVTSAKFASEVIVKAFEKQRDELPISSDLLKEYSLMLDKYLRHELEMSYFIQRISRFKFLFNMFINKAATKKEFRQLLTDMLANEETKKEVKSPLFYLKLLLP
ncbi:MAG: NAD(P)/FAD-dependent oxidoreductase [Candidatus Micrarchaeota archaeon]|nr:NAD(P)/FAD-dependent oxidoreductase [Candidatus Micrarchaeota archaeon]